MASIRRLSEGRYQITWLEGYIVGPDGKRRQRKRSEIVWGTRRDAERRAAEIEATRLPTSRLRDPDERTFARVAAEWLANRKQDVEQGTLEPSTWKRYDETLRLYAVPVIGNVPLSRLQPADVERVYSQTPPGAVRQLHTALRQVLRWALRERWIGWDIAVMVTPPRLRPKKRAPIPLRDLALVLAAFRDTRWFPLVALAFATGLRQGELLGLRWVDVDWAQRVLWVRRALKRPGANPTFGSRKNDQEVPVAVHESVLAILREHKERQDAEKAKYTEDWGLVFTATDGSPVDASNIRDDVWRPILTTLVEPGQVVRIPSPKGEREHASVFGDSLRRLGWQYGVSVEALQKANPDLRLHPPLPYVFHQLRHSHASYLLGGEDPLSLAAVARHGGWADPMTTLRHYTHAITEDDRRAAEKAAALLADALALGQDASQPVVRANVRAAKG